MTTYPQQDRPLVVQVLSLLQRIQQIPPGTVIPKPAAREDFRVKGMGKREGEAALVYLIPNHTDPSRPRQKGITLSEWKKAITQLLIERKLTKKWFDENLPRCSMEGACNFTTIGGILCLLEAASYDGRGVYRSK